MFTVARLYPYQQELQNSGLRDPPDQALYQSFLLVEVVHDLEVPGDVEVAEEAVGDA